MVSEDDVILEELSFGLRCCAMHDENIRMSSAKSVLEDDQYLDGLNDACCQAHMKDWYRLRAQERKNGRGW